MSYQMPLQANSTGLLRQQPAPHATHNSQVRRFFGRLLGCQDRVNTDGHSFEGIRTLHTTLVNIKAAVQEPARAINSEHVLRHRAAGCSDWLSSMRNQEKRQNCRSGRPDHIVQLRPNNCRVSGMRLLVIAVASSLMTVNSAFAEPLPWNEIPLRAQLALTDSRVFSYLQDNGGPTMQSAHIVKRDTPILQMGTGDTPWRIAQKNNPVDLTTSHGSADLDCTSTPLWSAASPTTRVCWIPDGAKNYKIELSQHQDSSTPNVVCGGDTATSEYDLFLGSPSPALRASPTLDKIASLDYSFGLQVPHVQVTRHCGTVNPWWDQTAIQVALVLGNPVSKQRFFYQIKLRQALANAPNLCNTGKSYWYFTSGSLYSANDYAGTSYGLPCPRNGEPRRIYTIDPLPRLKQFIVNSPAAMDKDLSHWRIADYYMGSMGYGSFSVTSVWDHITLTAHTVILQ
jgi:hypothetical protein